MPSTYPTPVSTSDYLEYNATPSPITVARAGTYNGAGRVYDFGASPGIWSGVSILDISAITGAATVKYQVCDDPGFGSGVLDVVSASVSAVGQVPFILNNRSAGHNYRYMRFYAIPGTTLTCGSWIVAADDIDAASLAQVSALAVVILSKFDDTNELVVNWANGTASGGDGSGNYPLPNNAGGTTLAPCPAKIAASAGLSAAAIAALTTLTTEAAAADWSTDVYVPVRVGSAIFKAPIAFIASRKTADLQRWTDAHDERSISNLVLQMHDPISGHDYQVTEAELQRNVTGVIDPTKPPYGAKFDARFARFVTSVNGSTTIEFPEDIFPGPYNSSNYYTGKDIYVSNAGTPPNYTDPNDSSTQYGFAGFYHKSTIVSVDDARHCTIANACTASSGQNDCVFGTDDTAAMRAALLAAKGPTTFTYGGLVKMPAGNRMAMCRNMKFQARSALFGGGVRQSAIISIPDTEFYNGSYYGSPVYYAAPTLYNDDYDADFIAMGDFFGHGNRFMQHPSGVLGIRSFLHYTAQDGTVNMAQVDPYPMMTRMHIEGASYHGVKFTNRHSGTFGLSEITNCRGAGLDISCYDANILNILSIGHGHQAVACRGANNNLLNVKASFSGTSPFQDVDPSTGFYAGNAVVSVSGSGNNFTNMRVQESFRSLLHISGYGNAFGHTGLDDAGCINPIHYSGYFSGIDVSAAIELYPGADDNRFNDVGFGPAVHVGNNYATHGVFVRKAFGGAHAPLRNSGRVYKKGSEAFNSGYGHTTSMSSPYDPRMIGTDEDVLSPAIDASNFWSINENPISTYYP